MRLSAFPLSTLKETPADAEIVSHQLMLRAGMLRKQAAGVYSWLPLGLRVLRRVEAGEQPFIDMWESMGGMARFDRRRDWWATARSGFAMALGVPSPA